MSSDRSGSLSTFKRSLDRERDDAMDRSRLDLASRAQGIGSPSLSPVGIGGRGGGSGGSTNGSTAGSRFRDRFNLHLDQSTDRALRNERLNNSGLGNTAALTDENSTESHMKEMIRIHDLWQDTKQDLLESKRSMSKMLNEYENDINRMESYHSRVTKGYETELTRLRDELKGRDSVIARLKSEIRELNSTNTDLQEQVSATHEKYAQQVLRSSTLLREVDGSMTTYMHKERLKDDEIIDLKTELTSCQQELSTAKAELAIHKRSVSKQQEALKAKTEEIQSLQSINRKQTEIIDTQADERKAARRSKNEWNQDKETYEREIQMLKNKIEEYKEMESAMATQSVGEFRRSRRFIEARLDKLQDDCDQVLSSSRQARGRRGRKSRRRTAFGQDDVDNDNEYDGYDEDSGRGRQRGGGGVRNRSKSLKQKKKRNAFVAGSVDRTASSSSSSHRPQTARSATEDSKYNASDANLPFGMSKLIDDFKHNLMKRGGKHRQDVITHFLVTLNRIWKEKLDDSLRLLRRKHRKEVGNLQRKISQQVPYKEVIQQAHIARLRKALDHTRTKYMKCNPDGGQNNIVDLALGTVENLSRQVIELEDKNEALEDNLEAVIAEKTELSGGFRAGAAWLREKTVHSIDTLSDNLWAASNHLVDKALKFAKKPGFIPKLSKECQLFLDALESDLRICKSAVKRAVIDAEYGGPEGRGPSSRGEDQERKKVERI